MNQSLIKTLYKKGLKALRSDKPDRFYEEEEHFVLGNAFDCLVTTPEKFNDLYYISDLEKKPSDTLMSVIQRAFALRQSDHFGDNNNNFLAAMDAEGWYVDKGIKRLEYKAWLDATNLLYWQELVESEGKQILTLSERSLLENMIGSLQDDPELNIWHSLNGKCQFIQQADIQGVPCKGLLDKFCLKEDNSELWKSLHVGDTCEAIIIDYKTYSGSSSKFSYAVKKYRYDVQMSFYRELISKGFFGGKYYSNIDCVNIVVNTDPNEPSFVWKYSEEDLAIGKYGAWQTHPREYIVFHNQADEAHIPGFQQMLERYNWYQKRNFEIEYGFESKILNQSVWNH